MGEYYTATLRVPGFPAAAIKTTPRPTYGGGTYPAAELDYEALAGLDEDPDHHPALRPLLAEADADEGPWHQLAAAFSQLGGPEDVTYDESDGELTWTGELSYGCTTLSEDGVFDALQALGLAFSADDDGRYEIPGQFFDWRPGWPEVRTGTYNSEAGRLLTEPDWARILGNATTLDDAAREVGQFFNPDPPAPPAEQQRMEVRS